MISKLHMYNFMVSKLYNDQTITHDTIIIDFSELVSLRGRKIGR